MSKKKLLLYGLMTIVGIYLLGVIVSSFVILPNTKFSEHKVELIAKSKLSDELETKFEKETIAINDDVITNYAPTLVSLGATLDSEALAEDVKANQNPFTWPVNFFTEQNYDLTEYITLDTDVMSKQLKADKVTGNEGRTKSVDAEQSYDSDAGQYVIKKEVNGNVINKKAVEDLTTAIENGDSEFDMTGYYVSPKVVTKDLQADTDALNQRLSRPITITFGSDEYTIPVNDVETFIFINDDGEFDVDNTVLHNYLSNLAADYVSVSTSSGSRVVTSYDIENSYYSIESALLDDSTDPINTTTEVGTHKQQSGQKSMPTSGTYIEVSISQQHMWVYNNDELIADTPVVTGNESDGRGTPRGTFSVWNKETDKVLDGSTVGYDYKVPVNYWMAIDYTGVGIHDVAYLNSGNAEEKSKTNSINGSHGCINTPNDLMENIYNNTPLGTPVYVLD